MQQRLTPLKSPSSKHITYKRKYLLDVAYDACTGTRWISHQTHNYIIKPEYFQIQLLKNIILKV